jgi:hypothetical protein
MSVLGSMIFGGFCGLALLGLMWWLSGRYLPR